jgi:hypothetical protein
VGFWGIREMIRYQAYCVHGFGREYPGSVYGGGAKDDLTPCPLSTWWRGGTASAQGLSGGLVVWFGPDKTAKWCKWVQSKLYDDSQVRDGWKVVFYTSRYSQELIDQQPILLKGI